MVRQLACGLCNGWGRAGCCNRRRRSSSDDAPGPATGSAGAAEACAGEDLGDYTVLKDIVVRKALSLDSSKVAELKAGSSVTVDEVQVVSGKKKVRGRIQEPPGWITLRDLASGEALVSQTHITPSASNLKAGHMLLAMSRLTMRLDESLESGDVTHVDAETELEVLRVGSERRIQVRDASGKVGWVSLATADGEPLVKQEAGGVKDVILVVTGADGVGACVNGRYRWTGSHEGAGLYQQIGGEAILYRSFFWKLNHHASTSGWYYAAPAAKGPRPPLSGWECHVDNAEPPPCVTVTLPEDDDCIPIVVHDIGKSEAATRIQAALRGQNSRQELAEGKVPGIPAQMAHVGSLALKDRTGARARAAAERAASKSPPKWIQRMQVENAMTQVAATRIQAAGRGKQARRLSAEKREAIKLAGEVPGRKARRDVEEAIPAAVEEPVQSLDIEVPALDETSSQRGFRSREVSWQNQWCDTVLCCHH